MAQQGPGNAVTLESEAVQANSEIFSMGLMSQESGYPSDVEIEEEEVSSPANRPPTYHSGNAFKDMCAHIEMLTSQCKEHPDKMAQMLGDFYVWQAKWSRIMQEDTLEEQDTQGEFVSCFSATEGRRKAKRICSATEPNRRRQRMRNDTALSLEDSIL